MKLPVDQILHQGVAAHNAGNLQEAERLYQAILQVQPKHPVANHNLGLIAVSMNQSGVALPLFKIAIDVNPNIDQFWQSYIEALIAERQFKEAKLALKKGTKKGLAKNKLRALKQKLASVKVGKAPRKTPSQAEINSLLEHYQNGRHADAEKLAISMTKEFPENQFAWKVLGALLGKKGMKTEALNASQKAVQLVPQDADAHNNLGVKLTELGRLGEAEASLRQAIALKSDFAEAHINMGVTLQELGRLEEAEASYMQAINLNSNFALAHYNLGNTLIELGKLDEAEASYRQAITLEPDYADSYSNLGNTLKALGRLEEAEASHRQAITLKPDFAEAHYNMGVTLQELGKLEEAEASYRRAIAFKPDYAEAHRSLASMKTFDKCDEQFLQMQELYIDESYSEEQRCHLGFGLAKAFEDLGNFEQAFKYYRKGNALRNRLLNYDISQDIELFKELKTSYPRIAKNSFELKSFSNKPTPVFIVGMPRSGTTLVEQIISSHSQVTGGGELDFAANLGDSIARGLSEADTNTILDFRENYLTKLESVSNDSPIVTDKMPFNFRYLGLLTAALPEAKIVHVKRNPAAVCWSNYKHYFKSESLGYSYALNDVVKYYSLYENLMEFWTTSLTNKIFNIDYDLLTINQQDETRKLIDYLGLDWEKKCLSPQNNRRSVTTASNVQVRQEVYQDSSQRWVKYKPFLNGALDNLGIVDE